jgi:hypothetical protein
LLRQDLFHQGLLSSLLSRQAREEKQEARICFGFDKHDANKNRLFRFLVVGLLYWAVLYVDCKTDPVFRCLSQRISAQCM